MNVTEYLLQGKENNRLALRVAGRDYTYGDLREATYRIANQLAESGAVAGGRVALIGDNSFSWVAAYLAILQSGLVAVPLPASIAKEDLKYILALTEPRVALLQNDFAAKHGLEFAGVPFLELDASGQADVSPRLEQGGYPTHGASARYGGAEAGAKILAALMFTSGSTGRPRGVMVSHDNIIANTNSIIEYLGLTEHDRIMTVLPFHYCFGTSLLHTHLRVGGSLVIDNRFLYPEAILRNMRETECTGFAGVPSHFQILVRKSSLGKQTFPHLRYVQQAGGHLAPAFITELQAALPGVQIVVMYGQTEATARLSYVPPEYLHAKPGSIGRGIPGVKLSVVDDLGNEVRRGAVGEIVAEGQNVALGYWRAPDETALSFRDGKLHTGDLATVDEDGFIYVVDRAKDFLKCGGKRISCRQIEEQLLECDELLEAAIVGIPDDVLGEAAKAFVVARRPGHTGLAAHVEAYCKKCMPAQQVPREIVVVSSLPKNSAGKVLKHQLREMVQV